MLGIQIREYATENENINEIDIVGETTTVAGDAIGPISKSHVGGNPIMHRGDRSNQSINSTNCHRIGSLLFLIAHDCWFARQKELIFDRHMSACKDLKGYRFYRGVATTKGGLS